MAAHSSSAIATLGDDDEKKSSASPDDVKRAKRREHRRAKKLAAIVNEEDTGGYHLGRRGGKTCHDAPWVSSVNEWRAGIERAFSIGYTSKVRRMLKRCRHPDTMIHESQLIQCMVEGRERMVRFLLIERPAGVTWLTDVFQWRSFHWFTQVTQYDEAFARYQSIVAWLFSHDTIITDITRSFMIKEKDAEYTYVYVPSSASASSKFLHVHRTGNDANTMVHISLSPDHQAAMRAWQQLIVGCLFRVLRATDTTNDTYRSTRIEMKEEHMRIWTNVAATLGITVPLDQPLSSLLPSSLSLAGESRSQTIDDIHHSLLHMAVNHGHPDVVRFFIDHMGADPRTPMCTRVASPLFAHSDWTTHAIDWYSSRATCRVVHNLHAPDSRAVRVIAAVKVFIECICHLHRPSFSPSSSSSSSSSSASVPVPAIAMLHEVSSVAIDIDTGMRLATESRYASASMGLVHQRTARVSPIMYYHLKGLTHSQWRGFVTWLINDLHSQPYFPSSLLSSSSSSSSSSSLPSLAPYVPSYMHTWPVNESDGRWFDGSFPVTISPISGSSSSNSNQDSDSTILTLNPLTCVYGDDLNYITMLIRHTPSHAINNNHSAFIPYPAWLDEAPARRNTPYTNARAARQMTQGITPLAYTMWAREYERAYASDHGTGFGGTLPSWIKLLLQAGAWPYEPLEGLPIIGGTGVTPSSSSSCIMALITQSQSSVISRSSQYIPMCQQWQRAIDTWCTKRKGALKCIHDYLPIHDVAMIAIDYAMW